MQDLVGQCFSLAEGRYRIVDVRKIAGDSMVYAERLQGAQERQRHLPLRAAFHINDIVEYISTERSA